MPILQKVGAALPADLGEDPFNYTKEQRSVVLSALAEACDVLDLTYTIDVKSVSKGGYTVSLFDKTGKKIYEYAGVVKKTDVDTNNMMGNIALAAGVVFLALALSSYVVLKKKALNQ